MHALKTFETARVLLYERFWSAVSKNYSASALGNSETTSPSFLFVVRTNNIRTNDELLFTEVIYVLNPRNVYVKLVLSRCQPEIPTTAIVRIRSFDRQGNFFFERRAYVIYPLVTNTPDTFAADNRDRANVFEMLRLRFCGRIVSLSVALNYHIRIDLSRYVIISNCRSSRDNRDRTL